VASVDLDAMVGLAGALVRTRSRAGIDGYGDVVEVLTAWQREAGLEPRVLTRDGSPVAVVINVVGARPGRHIVLDACLDTAAVNDPEAWSFPPFAGDVVDGWLRGRGAADSKAAVAVFSGIAADLAPRAGELAGRLTVLADLDEHTGGFAGIRAFLEDALPDGVFVGYPGPDHVVIGGRGVLRARITVHGEAGHTGSSRPVRNALVKAARLVHLLTHASPRGVDPVMGLPGKVTVTSLHGGADGVFSVVPSTAIIEVDVRLTPSFDADAARELLAHVLDRADAERPADRPSTIAEVGETWPPFRLPDDHWLPAALVAGARDAGLDPALKVAGPSNIGNLLGQLGVPATAGFGPEHQGLHGTDEAVRVDSIPAVARAYRRAVLQLLDPTS